MIKNYTHNLLLYFGLMMCMRCQPQMDLDEDEKSSRTNLSELGSKAGSQDNSALATTYAVTTSVPPAALRPDPDLYARRLLRQYRAEGVTVARAIGDLEPYRELLGGASLDFRVTPQEIYDATSLLALQKVTDSVCVSLVNPSSSQIAQGWKTILPANPSDITTNVKFLAQRIMGIPSSSISATTISSLTNEVKTSAKGKTPVLADYVPACVMVSMDGEALLL